MQGSKGGVTSKDLQKAELNAIGVHTQDEIVEPGRNDVNALSALIAERPFDFGNELTLLDMVMFANLASLPFIDKDVCLPIRGAMKEPIPNFVGLFTHDKKRVINDRDELYAPAEEAPAKEVKEADDTKEADALGEKQPSSDELEEDKGDEKKKELEKEAKIKPEDKEKEK